MKKMQKKNWYFGEGIKTLKVGQGIYIQKKKEKCL